MVAAAIGIGAGVSGITGLIGSSESASAQQQAAQAQAAATQAAIQAEQTQFQTGLGYAAPYSTTGEGAETELASELGIGGVPSYGTTGALAAEPSLTDLSGLPGYHFNLTQGLNAVNNLTSASGQAVVPGSTNYSGPQAKASANYAENLANTYGSTYLSNYWANQQNRYNMLAGIMNTGATTATSIMGNAVNVGGQQATTGLSGTAAANNFNVGAANTSAAGITGLGSNLGSSLLLANALGGNSGNTIAPTDAQLSAGVKAMYPGVSNP